jgi:hypothetical protein
MLSLPFVFSEKAVETCFMAGGMQKEGKVMMWVK